MKHFRLTVAMLLGIMSNEIAQAQTPPPHKNIAKNDANNARYIFGKDPHWHFIYGPIGANTRSVEYSSQGRNGYMTFSCDNSGREEFALGLAGVVDKEGVRQTFKLTLGPQSLSLPMRATTTPPGVRETVYYLAGDGATSVLQNMINLDDRAVSDTGIVLQLDSRELDLFNPKPRDEAIQVLTICKTWSDQHRAAVLNQH